MQHFLLGPSKRRPLLYCFAFLFVSIQFSDASKCCRHKCNQHQNQQFKLPAGILLLVRCFQTYCCHCYQEVTWHLKKKNLRDMVDMCESESKVKKKKPKQAGDAWRTRVFTPRAFLSWTPDPLRVERACFHTQVCADNRICLCPMMTMRSCACVFRAADGGRRRRSLHGKVHT